MKLPEYLRRALPAILPAIFLCARPVFPSPAAVPSSCAEVLAGSDLLTEELTYTIRWGIITAGTAVLRLTPQGGEGGRTYRIESSARSNSFIDAIYPVRDTAVSLVQSDFERSLYFAKSQREGKYARDEVIECDIPESTALLFRDGKLANTLRLPDRYQDPVSGLYRFRKHPAEPGAEVSMYATDGRRLMKVSGTVQDREDVVTPAGSFRCLKVELFPETLEGPFIRKKHGRIFLWFTDDACRIPVKMATEVFIGAVESILEKAEYRRVTP